MSKSASIKVSIIILALMICSTGYWCKIIEDNEHIIHVYQTQGKYRDILDYEKPENSKKKGVDEKYLQQGFLKSIKEDDDKNPLIFPNDIIAANDKTKSAYRYMIAGDSLLFILLLGVYGYKRKE